ncbi:MAG: bis(5'-nucleosyl)-tetraphosphatase (symmetrical) YqeK, partial [Eubacteriales bacterium]
HKHLDKGRYEHSIRVASTAVSLAMCYGEDMEKAELAGLLHDCAKCMKEEKILKESKEAHIPISALQEANPSLLHAPLGSYLAKEKYGIKDQDILMAIQSHTLGRANMSLLEKIIYVADYIEPERDKAPDLHEVRQMAYHNLDGAIHKIAVDTIEHLHHHGKPVDLAAYATVKAYEPININTN